MTIEEAEALREQIEEFAAEMWDTDPDTGRVRWEDWADRLEARHPEIDLGSDMLSPGFRRVQSIARAAIREAIGG